MDCKIVQTVDFLIVKLWIVLDGVLIATAQLLRGINPPPPIFGGGGGGKDIFVFFFLFFFFVLQALLLSPPPPPPLLSVFVCSNKAYSYPLPTVLCNENPSWLSTSGTDENGAFT